MARRKFSELTRSWDASRKARVKAKTDALQREMTLCDVRKAFGVAQSTLAEALGVSQGEVSRLERRPDVYISTLRRYVAAMKGELKIVASFPGQAPIEISLPELEGDE
jgi:transcriptional regulator with XRE-family HTH domain